MSKHYEFATLFYNKTKHFYKDEAIQSGVIEFLEDKIHLQFQWKRDETGTFIKAKNDCRLFLEVKSDLESIIGAKALTDLKCIYGYFWVDTEKPQWAKDFVGRIDFETNKSIMIEYDSKIHTYDIIEDEINKESEKIIKK